MGAIYKVVDDGEDDLMLQPIVVTQVVTQVDTNWEEFTPFSVSSNYTNVKVMRRVENGLVHYIATGDYDLASSDGGISHVVTLQPYNNDTTVNFFTIVPTVRLNTSVAANRCISAFDLHIVNGKRISYTGYRSNTGVALDGILQLEWYMDV